MGHLLIVAFTLLLPPPVDFLTQGVIHKGVTCLYRGEQRYCLFIEHDKKPYMCVTDKNGDILNLRYVVTIKDRKPLEIWSHDQRTA